MAAKRQILAMGGGGFSMEPYNLLLDRYLLSLCEKSNPKVCFIGTASSDAPEYRERFYQAFKQFPCEPSHIALSEDGIEGLEDKVAAQDIFYVGGGNTVKLLRDWRASKLDQYLRIAYERGAIMAGISAGSICWFEEGLSDSVNPGQLEALECLGWLKGSHCPHFDGEPERQERYKNLIIDGKMLKGWALDDGAGIHYVDEDIFRIVASHPDKCAHQYSDSEHHPNQQGIEAGYLGGNSVVMRLASAEELPAIFESHKETLTRFKQSQVHAPHPKAFVLEVYGSIKAEGVLHFDDSETTGDLLCYHADEAIAGKMMEDSFKEMLEKITPKEFC